VIEYIRTQPEHHRAETFLDEYRRLLREAGIAFEERYLV
jgi:putative transposase